jgi:hypothetical protein
MGEVLRHPHGLCGIDGLIEVDDPRDPAHGRRVSS